MYRSCITGEVKKKDAKHFMIGSEVDGILTEMNKRDNVVISPYDNYMSKEAREWRDSQILLGKIPCKKDGYEDIMAIAISVQSTDIWKDIEKNFTMQEIIQVPMNLGKYFDCLYGKLDAYKINDDGICDLLDLKTSITVDKIEFFYKALKLGYFKQLYFYQKLLKIKYPQIKSFRFWFVVAEKSEPYRVVLFRVPDTLVYEQKNIIETLIEEISQRTDYSRDNVTWDSAIVLRSPNTDDLFEFDYGDNETDSGD